MKITLLGATGGTGGHVLRQALDAGHDVTAVVRDASRLPGSPAVTADVMRAEDLRPALHGRDVVITALGPRSSDPVVAPALEALLAADPPRVILVSNSGMHTEGDPFLLRAVIKPILQRILRHAYADAMRAERMLQASGREWTIVRPPRLTNGPLTGVYRSTTTGNPRWGGSISRADLAHALLHAAADPSTTGRAISIAY